MNKPNDSRSRRRLLVVACVVVVIALTSVVGLVVTRGRGRSGASSATKAVDATTSLPTEVERTSSTEPSERDRVFPIVDGVRVEAPSGSLTTGASIVGRTSTLTGDIGEASTEVAPTVDLEVSGGELVGPVTVVFDIVDPTLAIPPDGDDPILFALHEHAGEVAVVEGTFDPETQEYRVELTSFSTISPRTWIWDKVESAVKSVLSTVTGGLYTDVDEPSCENDDAEGRVSIANPDGPLLWCAQLESDASVTVEVANRRRYGLLLTWSAPATGTKHGGSGLPEYLSKLLDGAGDDRSLVLGPGEAATVVVPAGVDATIESTYDGLAHAVTSLMMAADVVSGLADLVPLVSHSVEWGKVDASAVANCALQNTREGEPSAGLVMQILTACFDKNVLKDALGPTLAVLVSPLIAAAGALNSLVSYIQAIIDEIIVGTTDTTIRVRGTALEAPTTGGPSGPWPVDDIEGNPRYFAWMGANFNLPGWTSCNEAYCIAELGPEVLATSLQPLDDLGTVAIDTADPVAALVALGLPKRDALEVLQPGPPN
jgi:hypothetical protein